MPQPVTGAEEIRVSFRDQSADWSWESVIPLHKSKGERIATASVRTGFAMTGSFTGGAVGGPSGTPAPTEGLHGVRYKIGGRTGASAPTGVQGVRCAGRCGERTERCQWQKQRSERVAAVKISSVRRKAAQKFWAPQQDHRPLRGVQGVQWAGDRKGRPYERVARGAVR